MKTAQRTTLTLMAALTLAPVVFAQRNGPDWNTAGFDVQRSHWMKADKDVNATSMSKPGYQLVWKQKVDGVKVGLSEPIMVGTFIGWKGFKDLVLFQGGDGNLYVYDSDLGVPYFDKRFNATAPKACAISSIGAPGRPSTLKAAAGMTRPSAAPYHSVVGKPGEGIPGGMNPPRTGFGFGQQGTAIPGLNQGGRAATPMYTITADGTLHIMAHGTGNEYEKPAPFLPGGSQVSDISSVDKIVYAATLPGCGASPNTLFAMDRTDPANPTIKHWKPESGDILGAPAFSTEGNLYVTTTKQLIALDPKSLSSKVMATSEAGFASAPMIFTAADKKEYVAAGTTDGRVVLMDAGTGAAVATAGEEQKLQFIPTALATWEDGSTRYVIVTDKTKQKAPVVAYKLSDGKLQMAWTSTDLEAPGSPLILNGVLFVLATGEQRGSADPEGRAKGKPAVLYAYDAKSGKALWNSGTAIASPVTTSSIASGSGMIYLATADNTIYAFGFPQERQ
jgi:outer membrane protein assembly factor BamB